MYFVRSPGLGCTGITITLYAAIFVSIRMLRSRNTRSETVKDRASDLENDSHFLRLSKTALSIPVASCGLFALTGDNWKTICVLLQLMVSLSFLGLGETIGDLLQIFFG